jgi:hypothetical protein
MVQDVADGGQHGYSDLLAQTEYLPMSIGAVLLIVLILILIGVVPTWPYSRGWGYGPGGIVGVILIIILILLLMGRI